MPQTGKSKSKKHSEASLSRQQSNRGVATSSRKSTTMQLKRGSASQTKVINKSKKQTLKPSVNTTRSANRLLVTVKQRSSRPRAKAKHGPPRTEAQYLAKAETFKDTWERVIEAISKMRNTKASLTQAAREARVSPRTVTKYGKSALRKGKSGKYVVKKNDNLLRVLSIPTAEGARTIAVRGSKQASLLGEYWNAVHRYLQTGDTSRLKAFHGQKITDASGVEIPLLVDPLALNRLGSAGVLSFESIYARTT